MEHCVPMPQGLLLPEEIKQQLGAQVPFLGAQDQICHAQFRGLGRLRKTGGGGGEGWINCGKGSGSGEEIFLETLILSIKLLK